MGEMTRDVEAGHVGFEGRRIINGNLRQTRRNNLNSHLPKQRKIRIIADQNEDRIVLERDGLPVFPLYFYMLGADLLELGEEDEPQTLGGDLALKRRAHPVLDAIHLRVAILPI